MPMLLAMYVYAVGNMDVKSFDTLIKLFTIPFIPLFSHLSSTPPSQVVCLLACFLACLLACWLAGCLAEFHSHFSKPLSQFFPSLALFIEFIKQ